MLYQDPWRQLALENAIEIAAIRAAFLVDAARWRRDTIARIREAAERARHPPFDWAGWSDRTAAAWQSIYRAPTPTVGSPPSWSEIFMWFDRFHSPDFRINHDASIPIDHRAECDAHVGSWLSYWIGHLPIDGS